MGHQSLCFASSVVKWGGIYSIAISPKPKKVGRFFLTLKLYRAEEIPERVDTSLGGSNNAQALPGGHAGGTKCNKGGNAFLKLGLQTLPCSHILKNRRT